MRAVAHFLLAATLAAPLPAMAAAPPARHVLLISVDGMHALDLDRYIDNHPASNMAALARQGLDYTLAETPVPADSFPGLLALVTGGTPSVTGVYYDSSWDRALAPADGPCLAQGAHVLYNEAVDRPDGRGLDPARLPRDPARGCAREFPWQYLKVNTLFNVVHDAGGYTAWADKHPAYAIVRGPDGHGVDDLYTPEIGRDGEDHPDTDAVTASIARTEAYDSGKLHAVLRELQGRRHDGRVPAPVPELLGLNLQSVNVAQKLAGYRDASGAPAPALEAALGQVDDLLGQLLATLRRQQLADSTLVILTAKHGNGPIDPVQRRMLDSAALRRAIVGAAGDEPAQLTTDRAALVWLHDRGMAGTVARSLLLQRQALGIERVLWGRRLALRYGSGANDSRVPDLVVIPQAGVIYAAAGSRKLAEHGGFDADDTHVPLLLSGPMLAHPGRRLDTPVATTQVAPSVLLALGLDPQKLRAVRLQGTPALPGLAWRGVPSPSPSP